VRKYSVSFVDQVGPEEGGEGDSQSRSLAGYPCCVMSPGLVRGGRGLPFSPGNGTIVKRVNSGLAEWFNSLACASLSVSGRADVSTNCGDGGVVGLSATWLWKFRGTGVYRHSRAFLSVWGLVHRIGGVGGIENVFENGFFSLAS
jgi:hypothetical protein